VQKLRRIKEKTKNIFRYCPFKQQERLRSPAQYFVILINGTKASKKSPLREGLSYSKKENVAIRGEVFSPSAIGHERKKFV
jgi:hypothetical protein